MSERLVERIFGGEGDVQDRTEERILAAALEEFLQVGVRRARLEEVARRAGMARSTVHRRFVNKEQLVDAVLVREGRAVLERARVFIEAEDDVTDKIAVGFVLALDYARSGTLSPLLNNDPALLLPSFTVRGEPFILLIRTFLLQVLLPADPSPRDERAADVLARLIVSYCLSHDPKLRLDDPAVASEFAREHLAPIITGCR